MTDEQIKILRLPTSRIEVASIDGFDATWKSFQESFKPPEELAHKTPQGTPDAL